MTEHLTKPTTPDPCCMCGSRFDEEFDFHTGRMARFEEVELVKSVEIKREDMSEAERAVWSRMPKGGGTVCEDCFAAMLREERQRLSARA